VKNNIPLGNIVFLPLRKPVYVKMSHSVLEDLHLSASHPQMQKYFSLRSLRLCGEKYLNRRIPFPNSE
jgi:hypothetical protein